MGQIIAAMLIPLIIVLGIAIIMIISWWKIFSKAGQPGWAAIVPIYNIIVMTKVAGKPAWWAVLILLVPIVNLVFLIMLFAGIAKAYGKETGFVVGMILLPVIFIPILGLGSAKYIGAPAAA